MGCFGDFVCGCLWFVAFGLVLIEVSNVIDLINSGWITLVLFVMNY